MGFWILNEPYPFERDNTSSPTGSTYEMVEFTSDDQLKQELCIYLLHYFGNPPHTPSFEIPIDQLVMENDYLLFVRESSKVVGCIRYHYVGITQGLPIHVVDCFCIHPQWRKKGVGDYLLTELHRYSNTQGNPYALFLKEGACLPLYKVFPMYSSGYLCRTMNQYQSSPYLTNLSIKQAHDLITIYQTFYPDRLILLHQRPNQQWKLFEYRDHVYTKRIIIGIQDSFQRLTLKGKRMAWMTAWLETPGMTEEIRLMAANAVADSLYPDYGALWMDHEWMGMNEIPGWKEDGAFHWYTYQWKTSSTMNKGYALMM